MRWEMGDMGVDPGKEENKCGRPHEVPCLRGHRASGVASWQGLGQRLLGDAEVGKGGLGGVGALG